MLFLWGELVLGAGGQQKLSLGDAWRQERPGFEVEVNLVLEWEGQGTLVSSENVAGPYQPVEGSPTSPAQIPLTGSQRFFQIRQQTPDSFIRLHNEAGVKSGLFLFQAGGRNAERGVRSGAVSRLLQ